MVDARRNKGFTLIELLVVIAVLALLLAIVTPALNRAKNAAKVMMCAANTKQIGYYIPLYQTDNSGCVPKMAQKYNQRAQYSYLSVALRDYAEIQLPDYMPADGQWPTDAALYAEYVRNYLPDFFVCPFARGAEQAVKLVAEADLDLGGTRVESRRMDGRDDSYVVKRHQQVRGVANDKAGWPGHPLGDPYGIPAHGALVWHNPQDNGKISQNMSPNNWRGIRPAKWNAEELRWVNGGSMGDVYVVACDRGQHLMRAGTSHWYENWGSHKKGENGGTNALFGDMHVEWVNGHQIGW